MNPMSEIKRPIPTPDDVIAKLTIRRLPSGKTWLQVVEEAASAEGALLSDVCSTGTGGPGRGPTATRARHRAWYMLRADETTAYSLNEIAAPWGANHKTVMAGIAKAERRVLDAAARAA